MSGRTTRSAARVVGISAALVLVGVSAAAAARPGAGFRHRAAHLRVQAQLLDSRTHQALLGLYALDTRLSRARAALAALQARSATLQRQAAVLAQQATAERQTLTVARRTLASHLRLLYEEGNTDPLAVVLGARSLEDAITELDGLTRVAIEGRDMVAATRDAEQRLHRASAALAARRSGVRQALAAARSSAAELDSARSERLAFIGSLRTKEQLQTVEIRRLDAAASRAEAKSQELQAQAAAAAAKPVTASFTSSPASDPAVDPAPVAPGSAAAPSPAASALPDPGTSGRTLTVVATGYSLPGHTATGVPVGWGVVAVDPSVIPLGTRLTVPGYGEGVAADTGSAVRGNRIDLWFPSLAQALAWGLRTVTITLH